MAMTTTGEHTVDTSLTGRTALITGASKGLGLAMAKAFYCHGARVVLLARGAADLAAAEEEIRALAVADEYRGDADVDAFVCDVTDAKAIVATHQQAVDRFGAIDIFGKQCRPICGQAFFSTSPTKNGRLTWISN